MTIVERQHYVWRKYLTAWCDGTTVWCSRLREGSLFSTNPINVAVQRFFYALTDLTEEDIKFIQATVDRSNNPVLRQLNSQWLGQYQLLFALVREIRSSHGDKTDLIKAVETLLTQIEEQALANVEGSATVFLDLLIDGDISFYDDPDLASQFLIFLTQQYFRTKKIRDRAFGAAMPSLQEGGAERVWPIMRHIFATNVGAAIFSRRATMRPCLLEAPDGLEFITGDQPVINTHASRDPSARVEKDEFYYPVSPKHALLLSEDSSCHALHGTKISELRVHSLNDLIAKAAHEQLFARRRETLEDYSLKDGAIARITRPAAS